MESIILVDNNCVIIAMNESTMEFYKGSYENNYGDLSAIIIEYQELRKDIDNLFNNGANGSSCRLHYKGIDNPIVMDTRLSLVKDINGHILGILIIGREVKDFQQLKYLYKITDRELEIIQKIIIGSTNIKLAEHLGISENTLKRHIANIYKKLSVHNKIELVNLLRDFFKFIL